MSSSQPPFGVSCPFDGDWYACANGLQFLGCCTIDPCNEDGCSTTDLRPATFDKQSYGEFADQSCEEGQWYVCQSTDPPFLGCCASNPCSGANGGCPTRDLRAASLSSNITAANQFNPDPPLSASSSSSSITATTTRASSTSSTSSRTSSSTFTTSTTETPSPTTAPSGSVPLTKKPAFIGALVGVLGAIVLLAALWWWTTRIRASREKYQEARQLRLASAMANTHHEDEDEDEGPAKVGLIAKHSRQGSVVPAGRQAQQQLSTPGPNPWSMSGSVSPASPLQASHSGVSPPHSPPMYELSEALSTTSRNKVVSGTESTYKAYAPAQSSIHSSVLSSSQTTHKNLVYQQIPQGEPRPNTRTVRAELAAGNENKRDVIHDLGIRYD